MTDIDFDRLTDVELHYKLIENGLPNLPVTETTRNILVKKLKHHLSNEHFKKKRQLAKTQQHFVRYDPKMDKGMKNVVELSIPTNTKLTDLQSGTGSNEFIRKHINTSFTKSTKSKTSYPDMYAPPPILASESEEDTDFKVFANKPNNRKTFPRKSQFESTNVAYSDVQGQRNQSLGVVNRLLNLRDNTLPRKPYCQMVCSSDESDSNQQKLAKRLKKYKKIFTPQTILSHLSSRFAQPGFKQLLIPYVLICALVLFLIVIALVYMVISPKLSNMIRRNNTHYTLCSELDTMSELIQSSNNCIEKEKLNEAITFVNEIQKMLQYRAQQHHCVDHTLQADLNFFDFIQHIYKKSTSVDMQKLQRYMPEITYLIKHNPQWKISVEKSDEFSGELIDVSKVSSDKSSYFILLKPNLPLTCILYYKMQKFFLIIGMGTLIGVTGLIVYITMRYIKIWRNNRLVAVNNFTADIISELQYRASLNEIPGESEVIINHLRDKIIPFSKRNTLLWSWNEALRILEANDSRVQFGISVHNGEEYRTMMWTGNVPLDVRDYNSTKQWQSPAFDNANRIFNPPTPCLKIRHMFDSSEVHHPNLKKIIEQAILEKVGPNCKIYDIQLDKISCCVYVRCASEEDAGIVHNEINGWWFDKRLVSIKFLRLQRYFCRFPKSIAEPVSLSLSNTKKIFYS